MWAALGWRKRLLRALLLGGQDSRVAPEVAAASAAAADDAVAGLVAELSGSFPEVSVGWLIFVVPGGRMHRELIPM